MDGESMDVSSDMPSPVDMGTDGRNGGRGLAENLSRQHASGALEAAAASATRLGVERRRLRCRFLHPREDAEQARLLGDALIRRGGLQRKAATAGKAAAAGASSRITAAPGNEGVPAAPSNGHVTAAADADNTAAPQGLVFVQDSRVNIYITLDETGFTGLQLVLVCMGLGKFTAYVFTREVPM